MALKVCELAVCSDCLMVLANGDSTGIPDSQYNHFSWAFDEGYARETDLPHGGNIVPDGTDLGFSHYRCDLCRRPGGGDRFVATVLSHR